jgi:pyruvate formate lyase activating enzyme
MTSGIIFDIKRYAINDGPGIRTAIFLKGCPLDCWWCHNPEGQASSPQLMFRTNRCKSSKACMQACPLEAITWNDGPVTNWEVCDDCGKCVEVCFTGAREMIGRSISTNQLMEEIERDIPFYDQSGGGVTFTGGEPMYQSEFLQEVLLACKERQIHTVVDTCGHTSWENIESIIPFVNIFLYDLKLIDEIKHKKYTSVSNQLILKNLQKLSKAGKHIIVRIPLIPGINDDIESIELFRVLLEALPTVDGVELMPYHQIGQAKYQALGRMYRLDDIHPPTREQIDGVEELLSNFHLPVIEHFNRRTA